MTTSNGPEVLNRWGATPLANFISKNIYIIIHNSFKITDMK